MNAKTQPFFLPKNMRGARSFKDERVNGVDPDEMVHYEPLDLYLFWSQGYRKNFMLDSAEHENFLAHKC